jgi:hypothetical protein
VNALIVFPNRAATGTLSGGSFVPTLPLANLKSRLLSKVARTTDLALASTRWDIDQQGDFPVKVYALSWAAEASKPTLASRIRLRGSNDPTFATSLYDTGQLEIWPVMFGDDATEYEDEGPWWTGRPTTADRAGLPLNFIHVLPQTVNAQYWRPEIDDVDNAAGYLEFGYQFLAPGWLLGRNIAYGSQLRWEDPSIVTTSRGGADWIDVRPKYRVFRCSIPLLGLDEAYQRGLEMMRRQGISEPVLLIPDPEDTTNMIYRAFVGRLRVLGTLTHSFHKRATLDVEVKEIIA